MNNSTSGGYVIIHLSNGILYVDGSYVASFTQGTITVENCGNVVEELQAAMDKDAKRAKEEELRIRECAKEEEKTKYSPPPTPPCFIVVDEMEPMEPDDLSAVKKQVSWPRYARPPPGSLFIFLLVSFWR